MHLKWWLYNYGWIRMQCADLLRSTIWSRSCWLHRSHSHPVLMTVFIEPTYKVGLSDTSLINRWRRSLWCIFSLSRWQQMYVKETYALEYKYWPNVVMKTLNNLTESTGSSDNPLRAFLAAFCLASFLFFPTPSGYVLPFRDTLTVNLRRNYTTLSGDMMQTCDVTDVASAHSFNVHRGTSY